MKAYSKEFEEMRTFFEKLMQDKDSVFNGSLKRSVKGTELNSFWQIILRYNLISKIEFTGEEIAELF